MFEDIIGPLEKKHPTTDEIVEKCSTCTHAKVYINQKPRILCTIAMGVDCANNKETPFGMWKAKDV